MKKDVLAVTATAVAVIIMVVALVAMCAGPAQAAGPIHPKEESIEAQNRGYLAAHPCRDAIQAVTMREWEWLVTGVLTKHRTYGIPVPVTLAVEHTPRGWTKPEAYEPMPVELLGKPIITPRSDVVTFKTEDGTSTCTARYVKTIDQIGEEYDDWGWVTENVSVKGVGTVSVNKVAEKAEKRKASVAKR